jgi:hypothetical protein
MTAAGNRSLHFVHLPAARWTLEVLDELDDGGRR